MIKILGQPATYTKLQDAINAIPLQIDNDYVILIDSNLEGEEAEFLFENRGANEGHSITIKGWDITLDEAKLVTLESDAINPFQIFNSVNIRFENISFILGNKSGIFLIGRAMPGEFVTNLALKNIIISKINEEADTEVLMAMNLQYPVIEGLRLHNTYKRGAKFRIQGDAEPTVLKNIKASSVAEDCDGFLQFNPSNEEELSLLFIDSYFIAEGGCSLKFEDVKDINFERTNFRPAKTKTDFSLINATKADGSCNLGFKACLLEPGNGNGIRIESSNPGFTTIYQSTLAMPSVLNDPAALIQGNTYLTLENSVFFIPQHANNQENQSQYFSVLGLSLNTNNQYEAFDNGSEKTLQILWNIGGGDYHFVNLDPKPNCVLESPQFIQNSYALTPGTCGDIAVNTGDYNKNIFGIEIIYDSDRGAFSKGYSVSAENLYSVFNFALNLWRVSWCDSIPDIQLMDQEDENSLHFITSNFDNTLQLSAIYYKSRNTHPNPHPTLGISYVYNGRAYFRQSQEYGGTVIEIGTQTQSYESTFTLVNEVVITHNLNRYPIVSVINTEGETIVIQINHLDRNNLRASWNESMSGTIICY